jgi:predicted transglutaminase-like cysteine proteinase
MSDYCWLEKALCPRPINDAKICAGTNAQLDDAINILKTDNANLTREKQDIITAADASKQENMQKIASLSTQVSTLTVDLSACNAELNISLPSDLQDHSANFYKLPSATQVLLDAYMNKYPEGFVTYNGRYWGKDKTRYQLDVKAWLLEGQNDWQIVSMVKLCRGRVADVIADNAGVQFHSACDRAFMRVTHALGDSIDYTYDTQTWGSDCAEFWQFASETRTITRGDCEDKAVFSFVGCVIAGIPFEMLRLVTGTTYSGEGHCTLFYFASDGRWHHRNSTTNYSSDKDPKTLPLTGDDSEQLNIKTVWFSATQNKTFTTFDPTEANTEEKKDGLFKYLKWK